MSLLSRLAVQAARAYGMLVAGSANNVSADYLVVAGGASGGSTGGGGAGGLLTSTATLSTLNTYSITVGAGGALTSANARGNSGSNSVMSGTGLTTITATGGGGGGAEAISPNSGGSGGGGGGSVAVRSGGAGTSGQGNAGGNGNDNGAGSAFAGGGGGGAGAVGSNASTASTAGNGGNGSSSSISGSSVTYAGGGGGGAYLGGGTGTAGTGGTGGGGNGGRNGLNATSGTANTGGGGGGNGFTSAGNYQGNSGAGGSGIVIISYTSATPKFVGGTITTSGGKQIHTFTSSGTLSPITPITASYLVVAGGAGGGFQVGGGGGAGGFLTSSTTLYSGATYVVTVGAGGAGDTASGGSGSNGSNSELSGTGLTTITSTGGGGGASNSGGTAQTGGSGGGGRGSVNGAAGTSGQGFAGGNGSTDGSTYTNAGGGGGASAVGSNATSSTGGNGGTGTASSITGTSTTYAGGGGGGAQNGGSRTAGTATGGGGAGGLTGAGSSGTPNLGAGGGGGGENGGTGYAGGNGGSGIVIISYAGSQAFNGGLVTTSGGNTIHTFLATGALTPLTNNLNNSLRFRSSNSNYLNKTFVTPTDNKKWTYSGWVKRGTLGSASQQHFFNYWTGGTAQAGILFSATTDTIEFFDYTGSYGYQLVTTQVFRDPSAWYHFVIAVDTTQATSSNRIKMYLNGNQITAFSTSTYPSLNYNTLINSANAHYIGRRGDAAGYFDGYMTDINFIDGQQLEPYYFGNNDANGVWKPIQYKGTYGTNGFYLTFGNTTSTTTLGYDSSPNGNNWTCNNISLTAGVTYDAMTDVPTNTSATVANYCVLNALNKNTNVTVSNASLTSTSAVTNAGISGTMYIPSTGKYYWEATCTTKINYPIVGIANAAWNLSYPGATSGSYGYANDGLKYNNGSTASYGATYTSGDIIGVAFDADAGTLTFYKNNTSQGTAYTGLTDSYTPAISGQASDVWNMNFGQRPFSYTPPTGYLALNTFNLPNPTILQGNKYMDATLYTGTGTTNVVVNQAQFKPDLVWVKNRNTTDFNILQDSVRGTGKELFSNATGAEETYANSLTSFNSNGFTLGSRLPPNNTGSPYVGWQWQAGQGSTSSGTGTGGITSVTQSVNTTAGFSIVTYTGSGSNGTVTHGLGVAPAMVIVKRRNSTGNWNVRHVSITAANSLYLNLTNASQSDPTVWNSTVPTSTVFSIGTDTGVNASGGTYVAYCWAEIAGFSKFGSFTGNGSTDGPFVFTNFRPKYILIKNSSNVSNWVIFDTSRSPYNNFSADIYANISDAEYSGGINPDILSNGFKIRTSNSTWNGSGNTFIYMAFAENPFKNANAR